MQFDEMLVNLKQFHDRFSKLGDMPGPRFEVHHRKEHSMHAKKEEPVIHQEAA